MIRVLPSCMIGSRCSHSGQLEAPALSQSPAQRHGYLARAEKSARTGRVRARAASPTGTGCAARRPARNLNNLNPAPPPARASVSSRVPSRRGAPDPRRDAALAGVAKSALRLGRGDGARQRPSATPARKLARPARGCLTRKPRDPSTVLQRRLSRSGRRRVWFRTFCTAPLPLQEPAPPPRAIGRPQARDAGVADAGVTDAGVPDAGVTEASTRPPLLAAAVAPEGWIAMRNAGVNGGATGRDGALGRLLSFNLCVVGSSARELISWQVQDGVISRI